MGKQNYFFSDPLMDCRECKERFRADSFIEDWCTSRKGKSGGLPKPIDAFSQQEMKDFIDEHNIPCPSCGKHNFTDIRQFNLMFKTFQGVTEDAKNTVYLRPETAQGIFTNFVHSPSKVRNNIPCPKLGGVIGSFSCIQGPSRVPLSE